MRFLRKDGISGVKLNKGPGFFCFEGSPTAAWLDHTVHVPFLADLTYAEWLAAYRKLEGLAEVSRQASDQP